MQRGSHQKTANSDKNEGDPIAGWRAISDLVFLFERITRQEYGLAPCSPHEVSRCAQNTWIRRVQNEGNAPENAI